ncbi:hypothetical protein KUV28_01855 [Ferrimonas balearica]|nr:hypothetical protein [Ferrimonas balearica]
MRLELSDPIWTRLYGPYGVRDVPGQLGRLAARWDAEEAQHLFWEELHHQEELYPVSYAALPWLVEIAPQSEPVLEFYAQALFCAQRQSDAGARFRGLSLEAADHAHPWLPADRRLREEDMAALAAMGAWLDGAGDGLARLCLDRVPAERPFVAVQLAGGHAGWHGARDLPHAMQMWADGESLVAIRAEGAPDATDRRLAGEIALAIGDRQPALAAFLRDYVAEAPLA